MNKHSSRSTGVVKSRQLRSHRYRPSVIALEDRVLPAPINATFTVDSSNTSVSLSGTVHNNTCGTSGITTQGSGSLTTNYSGTLVVQWDLGANTIQFLSGNTVTAANSGSWKPLPGGGNGSAPANYGGHAHLSCPLNTSIDIDAAVRNLVNTVTSGASALSGSGGTYHFAGNIETIHINTGNVDYRYTGAASGQGSTNIAGVNSLNSAAQGTLADLGGGNFRLTIPIADTTTTSSGGNTITLTSSGTLVANVNLSFGVTGLLNPDTAGTSQNVTVTAKIGNSTNTAYRGTVHFASNDSQIAGLPGNYTFTAADNGVHTFSGIILKTAGSRTITVTDASTSNIVGSQTVTVVPADASSLTASGFPTIITAGTSGNLTVTLKDPYGNIATGYTGTVLIYSSDSQATGGGLYTFTSGNQGMGVFPITLKTAGTQSISATDIFNGYLTGTQSGIIVTPAPASKFVVSTDAHTPDVAGTVFDVTVTATDPYGNTDTNYTGTVKFSSADPYGATLPANYTFQPSDQGQATFAGETALYTAGTWDITTTDTSSGITGAAFVNVQAAPAAALQITAPPTASSGVPFDVTVTAVDPYGNTDTSYSGTITWTTSDPDPNVVLPADYTFQPGDKGMATFPGGVTLITPGDQLLMVTDTVSGITGSATVMVTTAPLVRGGGNSGGAAQTPQPENVVTATTAISSTGADQAVSTAFTTPAAKSHVVDSLFAVYPDGLSSDTNLGITF